MSPPRVCNIRASLGLGSSSSDAKWNRIQADAREILGCKGLLGKSATSTEVREKKLDATKELEKLYPSVFRRISSPSHRENIVYDIFTLEMDKFRGKERLKSRDPNNVPNSSEKIVVTISTPPVLSRFSSQLLRTDLVGVDGSISIDKLHEVLQEDGLGYSELKYSIQDEYGYPLSCSRHLQASFQRVANEGKLLTNWLISWDALGTSAPQPNPLFLVKSETLVSPKPPPRLGSPIVFRNDTSKKSATPEKVNPVVKVEKTTSSLNSYIIVGLYTNILKSATALGLNILLVS